MATHDFPSSGGEVSVSGSPSASQYARWASGSALEARTTSQVLADIGAAPLASPTFTGTITASGAAYVMSGSPASAGSSVRNQHGEGGTTDWAQNVPSGGTHRWTIAGSLYAYLNTGAFSCPNVQVGSGAAPSGSTRALHGNGGSNDLVANVPSAGGIAWKQNGTTILGFDSAKAATVDATFAASLKTALGVGFSEVYAYKTSDQGSIGTGYTKITFDAERHDTGSNFASSTFTAPTTQKYLIEACVTVGNDTAGNLLALVYYVNGSRVTTTRRESGLTTSFPRIFQMVNPQVLSLTAGDTVDLYVYNPANTATVYGVGVGSDTGLTSIRIRPLGA